MVSTIDGSSSSSPYWNRLMRGIDHLALLIHYAELPVELFPDRPEGRCTAAKSPSLIPAAADMPKL